ncbi:hypothetical protein HK097_004109 [Rhizophlyctis rosea]|uniref:Uncharacterized protein n=1 Tax=Rhizophlyctis rosea TaxID=64517 RepID=A0AAD5SHJ6_9FUNG|nr:hypothetical protein HK097_004109 [Rhizophlyctis rosea]
MEVEALIGRLVVEKERLRIQLQPLQDENNRLKNPGSSSECRECNATKAEYQKLREECARDLKQLMDTVEADAVREAPLVAEWDDLRAERNELRGKVAALERRLPDGKRRAFSVVAESDIDINETGEMGDDVEEIASVMFKE